VFAVPVLNLDMPPSVMIRGARAGCACLKILSLHSVKGRLP
jgi:hypothetical protein